MGDFPGTAKSSGLVGGFSMYSGRFYVMRGGLDYYLGEFSCKGDFINFLALTQVSFSYGVSIHGWVNGQLYSGEMSVQDAVALVR